MVPRILAVIPCRRLRFDGRFWTLFGVSHRIRARSFPHYVERLMFYVKLGSIRRGITPRVAITIRRPDADESGFAAVVAHDDATLPPPDRSGATDGHFPLEDLTFPFAGVYDVRVEVDGELIDNVSLIVDSIQAEKP